MRNKLFKIAPLIVGFLLVIMMCLLNKKYGVNYRHFGGYENILESMVNFLSIVIGFYSAFYGMIISMYKSKFMQELLKSKYRNELPLLLVFSLISAFACLILTIVMQSLITYKLEITNLLYYIWFLLVGIFVTYAFQTSLLSIAMIFESNPQKKQKKDVKL
mgnify:FL=1